MSQLRYPIGEYQAPETHSIALRQDWIEHIAALPDRVADEVNGLPEEVLTQTYRPGAWNIRQLVHHMADSHMNCLIRFKLAITEDHPTIRPYNENTWAKLPDTHDAPIEAGLMTLQGVHQRWAFLLRRMTEDEWQRGFYHPEYQKDSRLGEVLGYYAWHGQHHVAHIRLALGKEIAV